MANGMTPRKRYKQIGNPYPADWEVADKWLHGKTELVSRLFDFQVRSGPNRWFQFERYVHNTTKDVEWIEGFELYPYGGYVAFYTDRITKVRKHVEPKKASARNAANTK